MAETPFEAAGGLDAMRRLASAGHERAVGAPIVGHAFSHGFRADHVERLACFLAEALGGPPLYSERYGDGSSVVRMHSGNGEHGDMDDEAVALFNDAVEHCGLPDDDRLRATLTEDWEWSTRTTMAAHPASADEVPDGLSIWSWDGPVERKP